MYPKRILLSTALLAGLSAQAQMEYPIRWEPKPALHKIPDTFRNQSAIFILEQRRLELKTAADNELHTYRTTHRIIRLLDDKGVESFNTVTLPIGADRKVLSMKARTIRPDGKVIELGEDQIKKTKSEEGVPQYLFALEGVEKGSEVELLYTEERPLALFGSENFQFGAPILKADFSLIVPERLQFETKGYNGFPTAPDSLNDEKHFYMASKANIPALEEEPYSNYNASLQRLDFKLSYVTTGDKKERKLTWTDLAQELYNRYYNYTEKEYRVVGRYLASIGIKEADSEPDKIRKIEDALKTGIATSDNVDESYEDFGRIVDKKLTTEKGFTRFFAACLTEAGVQHELGLTSSRFDHPMDEALEVWTTLDDYLVYFPKQKKFLAPTAINFRYPFIPYGAFGNKGIFIKATTIGDKISAVPDIRTIASLPMDRSTNSIDAAVTFGKDLTPQIDITHGFTGYTALGLREAFLFSPKDKEKELVKEIVGLAAKTEDISGYKVEHAAFSNYYDNKPLNLVASLQSPGLMEKAGPKYLFKVGDIIGRQVEMYNDEQRMLPIDIQYAHSFIRTIKVTIPEGYKVANPEAVRLNVVHKGSDGKETMGFVSDYAMEGAVMKISIREFYDQLHYPVSDYAIFRKVINAAADFNKAVLVLQKI